MSGYLTRRDFDFRPPGYTSAPPFPSLRWPPQEPEMSLYSVYDAWRFTLLWTLILYAIFHAGAALLAVAMHLGQASSTTTSATSGAKGGAATSARTRRQRIRRMWWTAWRVLWSIPFVYAAVAAVEAVLAGSIVGVVLGAVYNAGYFAMSTWIPFIWGWINVLVLIVSSFTMHGGL